MAIPASPGADDAKRLAALDPDVLIDLAGLDAEVGPLLAQRPARAIVSLADLASRNVAPLIDDETPAAELEHWLSERWHALPPDGRCPHAPAWRRCGPTPCARISAATCPPRERTYGQVLALQPGYAPAHYLLGVVLRDSGDACVARRSFDAAVAAAPAFVDARVALAKAAQAAGDVTGAIAICTDGLAP